MGVSRVEQATDPVKEIKKVVALLREVYIDQTIV